MDISHKMRKEEQGFCEIIWFQLKSMRIVFVNLLGNNSRVCWIKVFRKLESENFIIDTKKCYIILKSKMCQIKNEKLKNIGKFSIGLDQKKCKYFSIADFFSFLKMYF